MDKFSLYFETYGIIYLYSLPYFLGLVYFGLLLVLRRSSLFGVLIGQVSHFSFILTLGLMSLVGLDAYHFLQESRQMGSGDPLFAVDAWLFPVYTLLVVGLVMAVQRFSRRRETLYVVLMIFFISAVPLVHKAFSGTDSFLAKAYFTEILYSPAHNFTHYFPVLFLSLIVYGVYFRRFLAVSFDRDQAVLVGLRPGFYDLLFYTLAALLILVAVRVLGLYLGLTALLVTPMTALAVSRTIGRILISLGVLTILCLTLGFAASFTLDTLPSSPVMILTWCSTCLLTFAVSRLVYRRKKIGTANPAG